MRSRVLRTALSLCSAGMALSSASTWAQVTAPATEPLSSATGYTDRVLEEESATPEVTAPEKPTTGWPRSWSAQMQSSQQRIASTKTQNQTLQLSGYIATPNYGAFSGNVNLNSTPLTSSASSPFGYGNVKASTSTWRIDQRAMPLDGGWWADNALGNINLAMAPLARGAGRTLLPSLPIEGMSVSIERRGQTLLNASAGRLGYFDGQSSEGFSPSRGNVVSAGIQTRLTQGNGPMDIGRTDAALQFVQTRNVNINGISGFARDTRSLWAAASWQGIAPWSDALGSGRSGALAERTGGMRVQANLVSSAASPSEQSRAPQESSTGGWIDATWRSELLQQSFSAFYFQPSLRWGSESLPSDLRGASWRADIATRQWQLSGNVELSDSVSAVKRPSLFTSMFGRYRLDSRDAVTANLAMRSGTYSAQSAQVTWEHQSDWGYSQWRTDIAEGMGTQVLRTGIDHSWGASDSQKLSTSMAVEQSRQSSTMARRIHWGVLGSTPFAAGGRLDLSLRGSESLPGIAAGAPSRFISANVRLAWPMGKGWSFIAQMNASRGQETLDPTVVSALTTAAATPKTLTPSNRSFLLALRYEGSAGIPNAPIGGAPGSGSGRIEGYVFFDHDNNNRREASEGGVAGVGVRIDRRYVTQTDAQGFYSFPAVAPGIHEIELVQDNLPLPWSSDAAGTRRVDLRVRATAAVDLPVQKNQ